ncbi:MAG: DUF1566 domain-containing protein [Deltaproteobacteria bacterium]|nr:DUF1566 domain-containing protein [Deltaproteobacteria bacterium]
MVQPRQRGGHSLQEIYEKLERIDNKVEPQGFVYIPRTGQAICWDPDGPAWVEVSCDGTGRDGDLKKGLAWPDPRFTDNGNGTVTDNLTELVWLKNANCAGVNRDWSTALSDITSLNTDGRMNGNSCGDTSNGGVHQTNWRLPNIRELLSLIDYGRASPALPSGRPFQNFPSPALYWSSTTRAGDKVVAP